MKKILIISFDMIRSGELPVSYSIASLLTSLKFNANEKVNIVHWSFNVSDINLKQKIQEKLNKDGLNNYDIIAISVFIWSEVIVKKLLVNKHFINFKGIIILGGKQIIGNENQLMTDFPLCKIFVIGYGESCIKEAIFNSNTLKFLYGNCENLDIPSPYLTNDIIVNENQKMIRMETKRGCPYSCSFCAHKDLKDNKIYNFPFERIKSEIDFFKQKSVKKINIIDPTFNVGDKYLGILEYFIQNKVNSQISLQVRFENIEGENGKQFIELCSKLNVVLEFGVQSLIKEECAIIERKNDITNIKKVVNILNKKDINYEVSLIYGLPRQTILTLKETINQLESINCEKIILYPLMLIKGTKLYDDRSFWKLKEKYHENNIPLVVESDSFSESDWNDMRDIAKKYKNR